MQNEMQSTKGQIEPNIRKLGKIKIPVLMQRTFGGHH